MSPAGEGSAETTAQPLATPDCLITMVGLRPMAVRRLAKVL